MNKANRITIGSKDNRHEYLAEHPRCEKCKSTFMVAVHHAIPQQWAINGQAFILDIQINYWSLCSDCHAKYEKKLNTLRDGSDPKEHVLEWIEQQPKDWLYVTVLEKIEKIIKGDDEL